MFSMGGETGQSRGSLGLGEVRCGCMSLKHSASHEGQPGSPQNVLG